MNANHPSIAVQFPVIPGNEISEVDSEGQIKLVISEMLNEGRVEASVLYGQENNDSVCFLLSPTFPSTVSSSFAISICSFL